MYLIPAELEPITRLQHFCNPSHAGDPVQDSRRSAQLEVASTRMLTHHHSSSFIIFILIIIETADHMLITILL